MNVINIFTINMIELLNIELLIFKNNLKMKEMFNTIY